MPTLSSLLRLTARRHVGGLSQSPRPGIALAHRTSPVLSRQELQALILDMVG